MKKSVLITGASRGLGASIAKKFAKYGYEIILTYNTSLDSVKDLKSSLEKEYNIQVSVYQLDLERENSIEELFSHLKKLDVLINNAACNIDCDLEEKSQSNFLKIMNVNVVGAFLMSKYAYPLLEKSNGNIVNVGSTNGIDSMYVESLDYDASKSALINLTQNLSVAYAPNVRVNAVCPGWIETHNTSDMNPDFKKREENKILLKRFADPSEVANLVYFLSSDEATYMTGSIVRIDGGRKYGN